MFDPEFYPTPVQVIEQMGIDCYDKRVLEPSAGSGCIVNWLIQNGAETVEACEKQPELRKILSGKCDLIADDFFNVRPEQVSHIHQIVMNPPFSNADKHILHAWEVAPEGCEIIALCNWQTVENGYSRFRNNLQTLIDKNGESLNLGSVFSNAERSTDVEIGLIKLFKPVVSDSALYDGFYFDLEEQPELNGIVRYDEIRSYVNTYVGALRKFDQFQGIGYELNSITKSVKFGDTFSFNVSHGESITTKDAFAKKLQKHLWKVIFNRLNVEKYVTQGTMKDINVFINSRQNYPFTVKNIWRMVEIIVGTREATLSRSLEEIVDWFTNYTHENRYGVEGWKTNQGHLLNKKFILSYVADESYGGDNTMRIRWSGNSDKLKDLTKVLCFLTCVDYDTIPQLNQVGELVESKDKDGNKILVHSEVYIPSVWYDWGFFEFKVFKKGSGHFKFKNLDDWATLNRAYAKLKGQVLPEKL